MPGSKLPYEKASASCRTPHLAIRSTFAAGVNEMPTDMVIRSNNSGVVLIVVMWIALGLTSVALYFGNSMLLENRASDYEVAGRQAAQAIEGARRYAAFVLDNLEEPGLVPDTETYEAEQVEVGEGAFWLVGRAYDESASSEQPVFGFIDEASKLNINTATLEMLQSLPDMPLDFAAAIIDWRDADGDPSPEGAESANYALLDPPYNSKDSDFETVEELRLVLGADDELLYGEDANRNGVLDPNENDGDASYPDDNQDGRLDYGLIEYLTVYTDGRINPISAPVEVLACLPGIDESMAYDLVAYRSGLTLEELYGLDWIDEAVDGGVPVGALNLMTAESVIFTADIAAVGRYGRGFRRDVFVFDTTGDEARVVFRRDLTRLGWPLGREVREQYAEVDER